ncbi:ABATE domain-containing protein [Rhodococcus erythropolis]|uniref:ABATE domain-containing protein n=1 Tax=Rhodococcus erythropolis TaxID=1833 RepID=UPI0008AB8F88|nr:hypothetical protein RERY_02930 [Rhodococcus erythropolis]
MIRITTFPLPPPQCRRALVSGVGQQHRHAAGRKRIDELSDPENVTAWLVSHALVPEGVGLLAYCLLQLTGLREHLRGVLTSHTDDDAPDLRALEALDRPLTAVPRAALLRYDPAEGLFRVSNHPVTQLLDHAMAHIAEDAAVLLTGSGSGSGADRVAQCATAPCDRFMVRMRFTPKSGQWLRGHDGRGQ